MGWLRGNSELDLTLIPVSDERDILPEYRGTDVGDLLAYHNLGMAHRKYVDAGLLIGKCMDHRFQLRIPANFAYVLRSAGANLSMVNFDISFAVAVAGVRNICVIGHDGCRMVDVIANREAFVTGLVEKAGWDRTRAEAHFDEHASGYSFEDVVDHIWLEAQRLRESYAGILIAPLVYSLDDHNLRQIVGTGQTATTTNRVISPGS